MIPVRLQLKNFMSYGEGVPPLDFTGIRLACLSGDNGNGKTALLDAMTWALFGETRAPSEDDVIRLGAPDVQVLFDFLVDGAKYRVHKARGRRGGAVWELQAWQEDGTPRSLSGINARETKQKIEQLLRMDYKTFLSSGYLAQGRADEFARATVADRKKVLADILDLSRYERLEEMAKERRKESEDRELDAARELNAIEAQLSYEDEYHVRLEEAQKRLAAANGEAEGLRGEYEKLVAEIEKMEAFEQNTRHLEERVADAFAENNANNRALADIEAKMAQATEVQVRRAQIEDAYMRFTALSERLKPLREQYETALSLQRESQALEKQIRDAYEALDRERYRLECDVRTLEEEGRGLVQYDAEIERLNAEIATYEDPDARRRAAEARRTEAEEAFLRLRTEHAESKARCEALQTRLDALTGSDAAECQYCGQPLPPARRQEAIAHAEDQMKTRTVEMAAVAAKGRDAKKDADRYRQEAERAQADLRAVTTLETQRAQASQERLRVEERAKTLPDVRRRYEKLTARIAEKDYAQAEQERLVKVSAHLEKMERISQQLQDTNRELEKYGDAERQMLELHQADEVMATEPARAEEMRALIAKREGQIEKAKKMIAENLTRTANLPALRHEQGDLAARLKDAEGMRYAAEREIGEYTSKLAHCAELKGQRERRKEERQQAAKEKDRFKELVGAFGKKGVQALIIENALPEIQNQANDLLARMTNGAMQVQLVTQREAKTKGAGAIETLDIIISDDMGTRPYEMYSGGEAFRINFALRVALSKMLTHRAGAPLQTLILDEGFGTQDPRGREAIVDALHTIADQFSLILVITHVEELKEAFPTRIEVIKGATGSTFTVV